LKESSASVRGVQDATQLGQEEDPRMKGLQRRKVRNISLGQSNMVISEGNVGEKHTMERLGALEINPRKRKKRRVGAVSKVSIWVTVCRRMRGPVRESGGKGKRRESHRYLSNDL